MSRIRKRGTYLVLTASVLLHLMTGVCLANPIYTPTMYDYAMKIYPYVIPVCIVLLVAWALLFLRKNEKWRLRDRFKVLLYIVVGFVCSGFLLGFIFLFVALSRLIRLFNGKAPVPNEREELSANLEARYRNDDFINQLEQMRDKD